MPGIVKINGQAFRITRHNYQAAANAMQKRIQQVIGDTRLATAEGIEEIAKRVYERSQELVPVDTGALRKSGFVKIEKKNGHTRAAIGYSKDGPPAYGLFVHENDEAYHAPPTQSGFLFKAVDEVAPQIPRILRDAIRRKVK